MATNYVRARYMEVIDVQTTPGKTTVIGIHTPVGKQPYFKLKGFFQQFRKYRYKGISTLKFRPAAGLPIDPLGLTIQEGSVDAMSPRDTFNPILFKGCHGESMDNLLNSLFGAGEYINTSGNNESPEKYGPSGTQLLHNVGCTNSLRIQELDNLLDGRYEQFLTDVSWKKLGIQQPFTLRNLYPLVWKMARSNPLVPALGGDIFSVNAGMLNGLDPSTNQNNSNPSQSAAQGYLDANRATTPLGQIPTVGMIPEREYIQEFTNGCSRLGWLPTTTPIQSANGGINIVGLPKLFMSVLVLPPSYNVQQFGRIVLTHDFEFKDFTTSLGGISNDVTFPALPTGSSYYNFIEYEDESGSKILKEGVTFDVLNGDSEVVSEGVC